MGLERERRFRARLPETLDIGEANPTGACTVEEKIGTANEIEELAARDESTEGEVMISFLTPFLETSTVVPERQRETRETEGGSGNAQEE